MDADRRRRPPADADRASRRQLQGSARRLAERLGEVDRPERFRARLAEVEAARRRQERIRRRVTVVAWAVASSALVLVGMVLLDLPGATIGLGVAAAVFAASRGVAWLARRRGAAAWDWEAGRFRLYGRPADRVQMLDRPPDARATEDPMGTGFERFLHRRS